MDRVFKIKFDNSEKQIKLYNWLITHENMEELVKDILIEKMEKDLVENNNSKEKTKKLNLGYNITMEELDEISRKTKRIFK